MISTRLARRRGRVPDIDAPRLTMLSAAILLIENWSWRMVLLLGLCVWGFCRAYYFAFYVIERWVDPQFKFSGLGHFLTYWWRSRGRR